MKDFSEIKGIVAVIPAAGLGSRMKSKIPKQYLKIKDKTILGITLDKFLSYEPVELIVLVVSPDDQDYQKLKDINHERLVIIEGGEERIHSVFNALQFLFDQGLPDNTPVMVHDAARPCILHKDLESLRSEFEKNQIPCMLVASVVDTLQKIDKYGQVTKRIDRTNLVRALTPQMAKFVDLKDAVKKGLDNKRIFTDEVSALTYSGHRVNTIKATNGNIKITHPEDLPIAEFYLEQEKAT